MEKSLAQLAATTVNTVGSDNNLVGNVKTIISNIIAVLGLVCVVVIVIGGINYMTSTGDTSKVEKAKKTILYGAIGLIISALAFTIVNFVITDIINSSTKAEDYTSKEECGNAGFKWDGTENKCKAE